jgi:hypothetical protein
MDEPREPQDGDSRSASASSDQGRLRVLPPVPGPEGEASTPSPGYPVVEYPPVAEDLRLAVGQLEARLFAYATDHPECRAAFVLLMALELWKRAAETRKLDAVAMGFFGMQHFFKEAPPDCDILGLHFVESPDGGVRVEPFPKNEADQEPALRLVRPHAAPEDGHGTQEPGG